MLLSRKVNQQQSMTSDQKHHLSKMIKLPLHQIFISELAESAETFLHAGMFRYVNASLKNGVGNRRGKIPEIIQLLRRTQ